MLDGHCTLPDDVGNDVMLAEHAFAGLSRML